MSLKLFIMSTLLSAAEAFSVVAGVRPTTPLRATTPKAMVAPDALVNALPTMTLAEGDIDPLFLASGTGFLFIPLMVVAIVVINFGIMKK